MFSPKKLTWYIVVIQNIHLHSTTEPHRLAGKRAYSPWLQPYISKLIYDHNTVVYLAVISTCSLYTPLKHKTHHNSHVKYFLYYYFIHWNEYSVSPHSYYTQTQEAEFCLDKFSRYTFYIIILLRYYSWFRVFAAPHINYINRNKKNWFFVSFFE